MCRLFACALTSRSTGVFHGGELTGPKSHPSRPFYSLFLRLFSLDISRAYVHILLSIIIINDLLLHLIHCLYQRVKKFVERIVEIGDAIKIGEKEKIKEEGETRPNSQLRDINDSSSG